PAFFQGGEGLVHELSLGSGLAEGGDALGRSEGGRDQAADGQAREGEDVVVLLDAQAQIRLGKEEVQAQGGGERRGDAGPAAAEGGDDHREDDESEAQVGGGARLAKGRESETEEDREQRAGAQVDEIVIRRRRGLVQGPGQCRGAHGRGSAGARSSRSKARFNRRTLTVGSPRKPRVRPSVSRSTRAWISATVRPRALATRGTCHRAPSGLRCGSRPLPEAVTSSAGTGPGASGFSFWSRSTSALMRSRSFRDVGPRLEPEEAVA